MPEQPGSTILGDLTVLDLSHQFAGAFAACLLADLGADVTVVEHPNGSPMRTMLPQVETESLWWKAMARGKRVMTLDLHEPRDRDIVLRLAARADVVVENFRPGTLERWGLGPKDLERAGSRAVMLRISGFGQTGPYRDRPGYGTIAEAISGFAHLNGEPDGPPMFPSATLADGATGLFGAFGVMAAVFDRLKRDRTEVQVVDAALYGSLFRLIPTQVLVYDQLGEIPIRPGNFLGSHGVLRNLYECQDGTYFCLSAIGDAPIRRILRAARATELERELGEALEPASERDFGGFLIECDAAVAEWARNRTWDEVSQRLREQDAVFQRVYDVADIVADPHYDARGDLQAVPDERLGPILMPAPFPKFPGREHHVAHAGPARGQHTDEILRELDGEAEDSTMSVGLKGIAG